MNISLTRELEDYVQEQVTTGQFLDANQVIRSALSLMKSSAAREATAYQWINQAVEKGWEDAQSGRLLDAAEVRSEMAKYKAAFSSSS